MNDEDDPRVRPGCAAASRRRPSWASSSPPAARGVLLDDRPGVCAGVFGVPRAVVLGRRLNEEYVELRDRATGERAEVPLAAVVWRA